MDSEGRKIAEEKLKGFGMVSFIPRLLPCASEYEAQAIDTRNDQAWWTPGPIKTRPVPTPCPQRRRGVHQADDATTRNPSAAPASGCDLRSTWGACDGAAFIAWVISMTLGLVLAWMHQGANLGSCLSGRCIAACFSWQLAALAWTLCAVVQTFSGQGLGAQVAVSNSAQLFFALTNSSITDIQLTQNINMDTSRALWNATGGPILRTSNLTLHGSPRADNPYYPQLDLQYMQELLRLSPGMSLSLFNMSLKRYTTQTCGPDLVAPSPGAVMYAKDVWRKTFIGDPYDKAVSDAISRPSWAAGSNRFRNLTAGLCVAAPTYACRRACMMIYIACEVWSPPQSAIHQTILDNPVSSSVLLEERCALDSPQLASCQQALSAELEAADRAADPPPVTVWARSAVDLVLAMVNSTVDLVLITQDIRDWSQAQLLLATMQLPVERHRNITLQGAALPGVYPVLDFQFIKVFIRMMNGMSVVLEQLVVKGLQVLPEPTAAVLAAVQWDASSPGPLMLKDSLWHYYTCPTAAVITRQLAAAVRSSLNLGLNTFRALNTSFCALQPSLPRPAPAAVSSLDAFPQALFTTCWAPAWEMTDYVIGQLTVASPGGQQIQTVNAQISLQNAWIVCDEVMDAACQQAWQAGNSTCVANRVAELAPKFASIQSSGSAESSDSSDWQLAVGLAVGLGGAAVIGAVVTAVLVMRARRKGQQAQMRAAGVSMNSDECSTVLRMRAHPLKAGTSPATPSSRGTSLLMSSLGDKGRADVDAALLDLAKQTWMQPHTPLARTQTTSTNKRLGGLAVQVDIKQDVIMRDIIGMGAHGIVRRGLYKGQPVALKQFPADSAEHVACELNILARLRHPNTVSLLGVGYDDSHTYLILELCDISLDKLVHGVRPATPAPIPDGSVPPVDPSSPAPTATLLPLPFILSVAIQVAQGLAYLHPTIIHRDLKASNILVNIRPKEGAPGDQDTSVSAGGTLGANVEAVEVKLADFGLSRMMASLVLKTGRLAAGTLPYMAPECFSKGGQDVTCKSDIYSFGVVLWELIHGQQPWHGQDPGLVLFLVLVRHQHLPFTAAEDRCPLRLRGLIERCWDRNPHRRPSAGEIVTELEVIRRHAARQG